MYNYVDFTELEGKIVQEINVSGFTSSHAYVEFVVTDSKTGEKIVYEMFHDQDCCEQVYIEDICGEISDLIGEEILLAEEVCHKNENPEGVTIPDYQDSFTWSFYKLATNKGYLTIRWYGASNGYYSERVSLRKK